MPLDYRELGRTGLKVSALGFGASSLGGVFRDVDEDEAVRTVHVAVDHGVNVIDVSPYYGMTRAETVLGRALADIDRDGLVLATKCGRYGPNMEDFDFSAERVTASIDESLQRLGVDHLDIYQAHDIEFGDLDQIVNETIPAMEKLKQAGKTRFIGVTGLPLKVFTEMVDRLPAGTLDTILSYCHCEINDTALLDVLPAMHDAGIGVMNASPLGMGLLSTRGTPDWHPAPLAVKRACRTAADHCNEMGGNIVKLAVQFAMQQEGIATTFISSADPHNMRANIEWADQPIDEALLDEVLEILDPVFNVTWPSGRPENN